MLANAWDVASARIVVSTGAAAVATTSAGVAWSLGAPDGDRLDLSSALDLVRRVAAAVEVPVTADIESGFAETADGVAETARQVIAAGAVGVNLEDWVYQGTDDIRPAGDQAERIAAMKRAAAEAGVPLFVNARTDVYLRGVGSPDQRLEETLARAAEYVKAGADGVFVPGVGDRETVRALADGIDAPLNVLVGPGSLPVAELAGLGVARISLGSSIASAAYAVAARAAKEVYESGTYQSLEGGLSYPELNALVS